MIDFLILFGVGVALYFLLFFRAKGAAIRRAAELAVDPSQARSTVSHDDIMAFVAGGLTLISMAPGAIGVWLLGVDVWRWLQTAEWRVRTISAFVDSGFLRTEKFLGWNKIVDAGFAIPAWLACMMCSAVLIFGILKLGDEYQAWQAKKYGSKPFDYRIGQDSNRQTGIV